MTNITEITGNIFTSECQTLVNTVNCNGVMGAGIALEFKLRHPKMFEQYVEHCKRGRIDIGKLWLYKPSQDAGDRRWVLNFPTNTLRPGWRNSLPPTGRKVFHPSLFRRWVPVTAD